MFDGYVTQKRYIVRYLGDKQSRPVFLQGTFCNKPEVYTTSGSKVIAQKLIFIVLDMFDLDLTFQGHLIVNSPFVPLHDWFKFWSDMFINSGDIAHWNMEKLPILFNGNVRCHGNVCYIFRINPFFFTNYIGLGQAICVSILRRIGSQFTILEANFVHSTISHR